MNSSGSNRLLALAQQLRLYQPPPEAGGSSPDEIGNPDRFRPKRAAVLICIFEGDSGEFRVILTKRSSRLSTHSGEVSLPGGKADESDKDDGDTATREAKEEIGLDPSLVDVITHLLRVVPVIGILRDHKSFSAVPNPDEVELVFDAPLEMFIKDENRRVEEREWMGEKYLLHFFDYETGDKNYVIWGLTAGILIKAASVVYQRPPAFLEQNPKYKFPRDVKPGTVMLRD
ncbi:Nudix hydrolase 15, mitochondrial [Linum perenne]